MRVYSFVILSLYSFEMMLLKLLLGISFALVNCSSLYGPNSDVIELTDSNFDKLVIQGDEIWIVEFYAPWCRNSKAFAPEYQKAATRLKGVVKVAAVIADEQKSLAQRFNIQGLPTVKIFGSDKGISKEYNGQRTAQGLVDAALSAIKDKVKCSGSKNVPITNWFG